MANIGQYSVKQVPGFDGVGRTALGAVGAVVVAHILHTVYRIGALAAVGAHGPHGVAAIGAFQYPGKDVVKAAPTLVPPSAGHHPLNGIKLCLGDDALMGVGYHLPFLRQLGGALLAFHAHRHPLIPHKVSGVHRAA